MFLGIDVGERCVEAVVLDAGGAIASIGEAPVGVHTPRASWPECEPCAWWTATDAAVRSLDAYARRRIRGIGLTGPALGTTLLGADDLPLRPAARFDGRCRRPAGGPTTQDLPAAPWFNRDEMELARLRRRDPSAFAAIRTILSTTDYVMLRLCGRKVSNHSSGCGSPWLDHANRSWSQAALGSSGIAERQLPRLHEGTDVVGHLRAEVATSWGVGQVLVAGGGGEAAAGAVGSGLVREGDVSLSLRDQGGIFFATADPVPVGHGISVSCHALAHLWLQRLADAPLDTASIATVQHARGRMEALPSTVAARLAALRAAGMCITCLTVLDGRGVRSRTREQALATRLGVRLVFLHRGAIAPAMGAARLARLAVDGGHLEEVCAVPSVSHVVEPPAAQAGANDGKTIPQRLIPGP